MQQNREKEVEYLCKPLYMVQQRSKLPIKTLKPRQIHLEVLNGQ